MIPSYYKEILMQLIGERSVETDKQCNNHSNCVSTLESNQMSSEGSNQTTENKSVGGYDTNSIPIRVDPTEDNILTITSAQSFFSTGTPAISRRQVALRDRHDLLQADSVSCSHLMMDSGSSRKLEAAHMKKTFSVLLSIIYAVFLVTLGGVITMTDQKVTKRYTTEIFSIVVATVGFLWLLMFHIDLQRYKNHALRLVNEKNEALQEAMERTSQTTQAVCNTMFDIGPNMVRPSYRFLKGRHGGSFYLKIGMAAFCFGHLIYEGLQLGQQIVFTVNHKNECVDIAAIVLHVVTPVYSFYQLFICFKYANVIINRMKPLSRFGLMHLIATSLYFWFSTIVEDALQDYYHKTSSNGSDGNETGVETSTFDSSSRECFGVNFVLSPFSLRAVPYLYPFTIEYNLLLAGVWFIVWQNIGKDHIHAQPQHFTHKVNVEEGNDVHFESNLVLSVDCHSANKGLFLGLFLMFVAIVTVIVFFVAITSEKHAYIGVNIYTSQEGILIILGTVSLLLVHYQVRKLNINRHPITFLDDLLMFLPLPFYFINGILSIWAEGHYRNYVRLVLNILTMVQISWQTVFVSDGLRRCSNTNDLVYRKPGRELITFLIILNLALWVVNTFQHKSVEQFLGPEHYFGMNWMIVAHATLPPMLFYRFHSSVCLADVWQSAYNKGE